MKNDVIARRYARALYDLAREEKLEDRLLAELQRLVASLEQSEEFKAVMESPLYDITLKKQILAQVGKQSELGAYMMNFLNILLEKDRFIFVADILDAYLEILDEMSGKLRARVTSATALDAAQQQQIADALTKVVHKEVNVEVSVDPALIGGVIAEVEGMIYDGSVRTQLSKLKQGLKGEI